MSPSTTLHDTFSLKNIELLKGAKEWPNWSFLVRNFLLSKDLWSSVESSTTAAGATTRSATAESTSADARAFAHIVTLIDASLIPIVRNVKTASAAWAALKKHCNPKDFSSFCPRKAAIWRIQYDDKTAMSTHINKISDAASTLESMGQEMTPLDIACVMLESLPSTWSTWKTIFFENNKAAAEYGSLQPETVAAALTNEYELRRLDPSRGSLQNKTTAVLPVASHEQTKQQYKSKARKPTVSSKQECSYCKAMGRYAGNHSVHHCRIKAEIEEGVKKGIAQASEAYNSSGRTVVGAIIASASRPGQCTDIKIDTCAEVHVVNDLSLLSNFVASPLPIQGTGATSSPGYGTLVFSNRAGREFEIKQVYYLPHLPYNVLSAECLQERGCDVEIHRTPSIGVTVSFNGEIVARSHPGKGYALDIDIHRVDSINVCTAVVPKVPVDLVHRRFGHVDTQEIIKAVETGAITGLRCEKGTISGVCEACVVGRHTRTPFHTSDSQSNRPLDLVYVDLGFPAAIGFQGQDSYLVIVDDYSKAIWVEPLWKKSHTFTVLKNWILSAENLRGVPVKAIQSDRGGEFTSHNLARFLESKGIQHRMTTAYTHQSNGAVERVNRTIADMARSMLAETTLGKEFWPQAFNALVYTKNRTPHAALKGKTPYELYHGKAPDVSLVRTFGSIAFYHAQDDGKRKKLDDRAIKAIFVGYSRESKAWQLLDIEKNQIVVSRDVKFAEDGLASVPPIFGTSVDAVQIEASIGETQVPYVESVDDEDVTVTVCVTTKGVVEPTSYAEAINSEYSLEWIAAISSELDSLVKHDVFDIVKLPPHTRTISVKWVFKLKLLPDGSIDKFKARLVARGFTQTPGVDFTETYAPVARFTSIRTLFAYIVQMGMVYCQLDVETAYLNSPLEEEIYVAIPEGFSIKHQPGQVLRLKKALYGLKQSGREWANELRRNLIELGFVQSIAEPCLYTKKESDGSTTLSMWYVDDAILACKTNALLKRNLDLIESRFSIKTSTGFFLGLEIAHDARRGVLTLKQSKYINDVLASFKLEDSNPTSTPMSNTYVPGTGEEYTAGDYAKRVGMLMWCCITRPDIAYAVGRVATQLKDPRKSDEIAVKRILRYLKGTSHFGITFRRRDNTELVGYSDAGYAECNETRKSVGGFVFMYASGPISFSSKRQSLVSTSTTEAEYLQLSLATKEAIWLSYLLADLGIAKDTINIFEDNQAAIAISKDPSHHGRTKHFDILYHYVREQVTRRRIRVEKVDTSHNVADIFTKALAHDIFVQHRTSLGVTEAEKEGDC